MKYLGGKAKIAKPLAAAIRANTAATHLWEPFCGGLNVTKALVDVGFRVYASDAAPALISLHAAWREGWRPPPRESLTRADYHAAKTLSDADPLKGFFGYGLSYCGKWFAGYVNRFGRVGKHTAYDYRAVCAALDRDTPAPSAISCVSFLSVTPARANLAIYCDPPYAGTTGYSATGAFDHTGFWARCRWWAACGVDVFVSEYTAPPDVTQIAEWSKRKTLARGPNEVVATDRLFLVR